MGEFSWTGVTEVGCSSLLSGTVEIRGTIQQGLFLFFGFRGEWGTLALVFIFQQDDTFKAFHGTAVLHPPHQILTHIFNCAVFASTDCEQARG